MDVATITSVRIVDSVFWLSALIDFMICPFCQIEINGITGLQEAQAFQDHLNKCLKNPDNAVLSDGEQTVMTAKNHSLNDALRIRAESGQ